jgi:hypothetical protein
MCNDADYLVSDRAPTIVNFPFENIDTFHYDCACVIYDLLEQSVCKYKKIGDGTDIESTFQTYHVLAKECRCKAYSGNYGMCFSQDEVRPFRLRRTCSLPVSNHSLRSDVYRQCLRLVEEVARSRCPLGKLWLFTRGLMMMKNCRTQPRSRLPASGFIPDPVHLSLRMSTELWQIIYGSMRVCKPSTKLSSFLAQTLRDI